jgi:acetyltransferase-like isoleucine patch superfamily enzyme
MSIDGSAIIYPGATLGENAIVEPFAIVGIQDRFHPPGTVVIGRNAFIGSRCTVYNGVIAGDDFDLSDQSTVFVDNVFGDQCRIGPKAVVKHGCRFGNRIRLGSQAFVEKVEIHDDVFIGPGTVFTDDIHPVCPRRADCVGRTVVESFVSIGAMVVIAPGIRIGHHSQIYAGTVVTRDVEPYSVMAGNPGKRVKTLDQLICSAGLLERPFIWWDAP